MKTRTLKLGAAGAAVQSLNILKEAGNRLLSAPDSAAYLLGVKLYKKLRLRVVILRDENGRPLATEAEVLPSIREASRIFAQMARVRIVLANPPIVILPNAAPTKALNVHCDDGAWQDDLSECGAYFRQVLATTRAGKYLGYSAPVTIFIVRDISLKGGCSLGPLVDYVTLEAGMLNRARNRILAHEVGHACGLWHAKEKANLMFPLGPGDLLEPWQAAIIRNSRHVTFL